MEILKGINRAASLHKPLAQSPGSNNSPQDQKALCPSMPPSANSSFDYSSDDSFVAPPQSQPMEASQSQESYASSHAGSSFEVPHMSMAPPPTPTLLSSMAPQVVNSPQQAEPQLRTAKEVAISLFGLKIKIDSAVCQRLGEELAKRNPLQRRPYQELNTERRSNVEAVLCQITGDEPREACRNCHKGHGPWKTCVVKEGQLCGSCANCWFNASGSRCTFHGQYEKTRSVFRYLDGVEREMKKTNGRSESHNPQGAHNPQPAYHAHVPYNPQTAYAPQQAAQPPATFPQPAAAPQLTTGYQPTNILQQLAQLPTTNPQLQHVLAALCSWKPGQPTADFVTETMGTAITFDRQTRYLARIQAAAKELGIRIGEYEDYMESAKEKSDEMPITGAHQSPSGTYECSEASQSPAEAPEIPEAPEAAMG